MAVKFVVNFCSVCGLILLSSTSISGIELSSDLVREWANRIGEEACKFTEDLTGAKYLKQAYENVTFSTREVNGNEVLNRMKTEMEVFFRNKTSSLKKLVDKAEDAYCKYKYNKNLKLSAIDYPNAKDLDQYLNRTGVTLEYNSTFQSEISFNRSVIHVPTDVYDGAAEIVNGIKWTSALDEVFDRNRHGDPTLSWQYFGSNKGFMRTYPAKRWDNNPSQVDLFDARRRPWYIQGATSPKNIVILIDASGSMHGVPMRIAKLSAQNLIDTFGDNDFFNVIYFNKAPYVLCCSDTGPPLLQATKKNKIYVKRKLQDIKDGDVAMWKDGMNKAFELLRKANNSALCQQAIMVLSDGTTSSLSDVFKENNPDKKVRVFTFAVGPPAESTQALRKMACNNRGYFSRIQSVGAVREVSEDYIRVLTRPMAMAPKENITDHTVWTSVYFDALGLGMMTTGTLPVFHRISSNCATKDGMQQEEKAKDHFLGVMGTDVPLDYLQDFMLQPLVGPSGYIFAVNNNGMVIFHPRLKTVYGYLLDPPGVDLMDVETAVTGSKILELRKAMIDTVRVTEGTSPSRQSFEVYDLSVDQLRVVKHTLNYYFHGLKGTSFSLGVATPKLGYKYELTGKTHAQVISELYGKLLKENSKNVAVERWPYCRSIVFSDSSPLEQLINDTKSVDTNICHNEDLLSGLLVDLNVTSNILNVWNSNSKSHSGIKEIFVKTYWGLTRSVSKSQNKLGSSSQGNILGKVFGSQLPNTTITYTTPYIAAKSDENTTSVFAYKRAFNGQRPAAVLGYEMDMDSFVTEHFVKNTKVQCQSNGPNCDMSCDRTSKNEYEGLYCYLLDENGFVVAGNDESSAGRFFGRVDAPVMETLIRSDANSGSGVYNKVVATDFQAVCEEKSGVNSRGTSFLLKPLFSLSAYTEWWTSKAVWSLLYFNLYSWIFSESGAATEAVDDVPKNVSCIKNMTTYYATTRNITEQGTTKCGDCSRTHAVASVPHSNLYLVAVDGKCGPCSESVKGMTIPGEATEISREDVADACKEPGYRKRPMRCFVSTDPETGYMCGVGSCIRPSLQVIAAHLWTILVLWKIIGFL